MNVVNPVENSSTKLAHVVYALLAVSFFLGVTLFIAAIISYVKRSDVKGDWLESHFTWQIRSFWYTLLWLIFGSLTFKVGIGAFILMGGSIWLLYRIIKGWIYLYDKKPMYLKSP